MVGEDERCFAKGRLHCATETTLPIVTTTLFAADGWPSEPSRIFFGGDDGVTFRDFSVSVVPEPVGCVLWLGLSAALVSRRRVR